MGYRWYDPALRRFTTIDPIKSGANWYAYCGNDPVNYVDPLGLKEIEWAGSDAYSDNSTKDEGPSTPAEPVSGSGSSAGAAEQPDPAPQSTPAEATENPGAGTSQSAGRDTDSGKGEGGDDRGGRDRGESSSGRTTESTVKPLVKSAGDGILSGVAIFDDVGFALVTEGTQLQQLGNMMVDVRGLDVPLGTSSSQIIDDGLALVAKGRSIIDAGSRLSAIGKSASILGIAIQAADVVSVYQDDGVMKAGLRAVR